MTRQILLGETIIQWGTLQEFKSYCNSYNSVTDLMNIYYYILKEADDTKFSLIERNIIYTILHTVTPLSDKQKIGAFIQRFDTLGFQEIIDFMYLFILDFVVLRGI